MVQVGKLDETIKYYKENFGMEQLRYRDVPDVRRCPLADKSRANSAGRHARACLWLQHAALLAGGASKQPVQIWLLRGAQRKLIGRRGICKLKSCLTKRHQQAGPHLRADLPADTPGRSSNLLGLLRAWILQRLQLAADSLLLCLLHHAGLKLAAQQGSPQGAAFLVNLFIAVPQHDAALCWP